MSVLGLRHIIRHALREDVSSSDVLDAIENKYYVKIRYDDGMEGTESKGVRTIQPMAVGTTKKGYPVVRAFQLNGSSRRGAPKWKFFRLDRITTWRPLRGKRFMTVPDPSYGQYNYDGDKTMGTFQANAQFDMEMSPLDTARAERQTQMNAPKASVKKNATGPLIPATQQWKRNVYTSQPNSAKYAQAARNIDATSDEFNRLDDDIWARAEAEKQAQDAARMSQVQRGPLDDYETDEVDYDENDFYNNNKRR